MEKPTMQIDFTRKKKFGEIMNETYRLLSGNRKLLMKLLLIGLVPAIILPYLVAVLPVFSPYLAFFTVATPFYPGFSLAGITLKLFAAFFFIQVYLNTLPYAFVRNYMRCREEQRALTFTDTLRHFLKTDIPKGLLLFIVLLIPVLITFPIALYAYIPVFMIAASYMLQKKALWQAIKEGSSLGTRYWARSVSGALVVFFISGILALIFMLPYFVMLYARGSALASGLEGNEAILPWYFNPLLFIVCALMQFVAEVCNLFGITASILHFYNLKARQAEKIQSAPPAS